MAQSSLSSWSERASTLPPRSSYTNDSGSNYSSDSDSVAESEWSLSSVSEAPWIIPYILESRFTHELPLRVMFSFNSGHPLSSVKKTYGWWHSGKDGRKIIAFFSSLDKITPTAADARILSRETPAEAFPNFSESHCPYDRFMDSGNEDLLKVDYNEDATLPIRRASQGLPPDFVQKMVLSGIFRPEYKDIEFQHALTGLDYLRDLEITRRCCLREAAMRLNITVDNWRDVLAVNMGALEWVEEILKQETMIEAYYSRIYVNIRIWIMVHELRQPTFYKLNVLALLNTLFPPGKEEQPNNRVLANVMHKHRATLYHYMLAIESGSRQPLETFVAKHLRIGTSYSWPETRLQLEKYIELAHSMIQQSRSVHAIEFFQPHPNPRRREVNGDQLAPRSTPVTTPHASFDSGTSTASRLSSGNRSLHARPRKRPRATILHGTHFNDATSIRSPQIATKTSELRLQTQQNLSNDSTPLTSTRSNSSPNRISYSSQRGNPFDSPIPEPSMQALGNFTDFDGPVAAPTPMMSRPVNPLGLQHQRTNSSSKSQGSQKLGTSNDYRRHLPRRDSTLRNMELPSDNREFLNHPYPFGRTPIASPNPSPPKLNQKSSFGKLFLRNVKSAAPTKETFPEIEKNGDSGTSLMQQQTPKIHGLHSKNDSNPVPNGSSFARRSTSASRPSILGGNPLGIFTTSLEGFPILDRQNSLEINLSPSKIVTPLLEHHEFTGIRPEFTPRSTPRLRHNSSFAHLAKQSTSSGSLGRRERAFVPPPTPDITDTRLPFERFPSNHKTHSAQQKPQLKKQRSFGFLESTKSRETGRKVKSPAILPTSAFATGSPFSGLDPAMKNNLKKKSSMPTLNFLSRNPKGQEDGLQYWETNDPNERLIITKSITPTPRSVTPNSTNAFSPATPGRNFTPNPTIRSFKKSTTRKSLRLAKSELSLRSTTSKSGASSHTVTPKSYLTTPHKLFQKFSRDRVLSSADISEPFPPALQKALSNHQAENSTPQNTPSQANQSMPDIISALPPYAPGGQNELSRTYIPPTTETFAEYERKEYTRKWFLEESRARKHDLVKPSGGPFRNEDGVRSERLRRFLRRERPAAVQEMPRASRKKIERPEARRRQGGIFEQESWESRWGRKKGKEKLKYKAVEVGRYDRY